jgi:hypothetical protein
MGRILGLLTVCVLLASACAGGGVSPRPAGSAPGTPAASFASTFKTTADYGLALVFPAAWVEQEVGDMAFAGVFFTARRTQAGLAEDDQAWVAMRFGRTEAPRGNDGLANAVAEALAASGTPLPDVSYADTKVGRVAVFEQRRNEGTSLTYLIVDPRLTDSCASYSGGYAFVFSYPVEVTDAAAARTEADAIVQSGSFAPLDAKTLASLSKVICPATPVPLPSSFAGQYRTLEAAGSSAVSPSLAIGMDGNPIISYQDRASDDLALYACADPDCSTGTVRTLDAPGTTGLHSAMAIGTDGNPVIRYWDADQDDLRFYACADPKCSSGTARTLVSDGDVGYTGSIAIGADGNPIITFTKWINAFYLEVYACADPKCTGGVVRDLGLGGLLGSVAIGSDGNPVIAFRGTQRGSADSPLKFYACSDITCSAGTVRTLDSDQSEDLELAIGRAGNPVIAYSAMSKSFDESLRLYVCADAVCSAGTVRTLDTNGFVEPSIAIDGRGYPVIGYGSSPGGSWRNDDLITIYACTATDCSTGSIFMPGTAGKADGGTSIRVAPDGTAVIVYCSNPQPTGTGLRLIVARDGISPADH